MISFVIPVFNEEESLPHFYDVLTANAKELNTNYEIVFIDDGSTDKTLEYLKEVAKKDSKVNVFSFRRNLGKSEALTCGFMNAKGNLIVTLDADLQDRPEEIKKLLEKQKEGFDLVSGWKKDRHDAQKMVVISHLFNSLVGWLFDLKLHDYNCGFKVYTKEAAKSLRLYGGLHRFIPVLVYQQGFTVTEVPVQHAARKYGTSKYGFNKIFEMPDIFTMLFLIKYGKRPLHFFGFIGGVFSVIGLLILLYFTFVHTFNHVAIGGRPLLYIGLLLVIAGLQIFFTGFLADLMISISNNPARMNEKEMQFPIKFATE